MFFSLSGFLIIRMLYLEKMATGAISIKKFYTRRALRIFPLYFLIVLFGLVYYNFFLPQIGIPFERNYHLAKGVLLCLFFLPNVFLTYQPGGILEILWSIGIEEQFYLLIAPALYLIRKKYIPSFLLAFTCMYFALYVSGLIPALSTYFWLFFYFSFGGYIAIVSGKFPLHIRENKFIKLLLLLLFILYFTTSLATTLPEGWYHLTGMVLFGLFLWSVTDNPLFEIKNPKLIYLGTISYGIYMFHAIAMHAMGFLALKTMPFIKISGIVFSCIFTVAVLLLTIVLAGLSYRYYELYFMRLKTKYSGITTN